MHKVLRALAGAGLVGAVLLALAYYKRDDALRVTHDLDRTLVDSNEAIRLDPKDAHAYNNRGIAYRAKGELDRAIADYNEAIRLDPR